MLSQTGIGWRKLFDTRLLFIILFSESNVVDQSLELELSSPFSLFRKKPLTTQRMC